MRRIYEVAEELIRKNEEGGGQIFAINCNEERDRSHYSV